MDDMSWVNEPLPTVPATPFSEGINLMTDDEQQIAQAIARAFETLSDRLSKELEDAFNRMAQLMGRAQKQQYEIMALFGKQAAAMEALADFVAKVRNDDVERHNEHAAAIEQLLQGQLKIAQFTNGLATQYGQLFRALSNRLDAVEREAFGPNYNQQPSTPPLN
jgi:curved DNA-binding protein CbpA